MRRVIPPGPATGVVGVLGLLVGLDAVVDLGARGWVVGLAFGLVLALALSVGLAGAGRRDLLPADRVTMTRAVLVCGAAALTAQATYSTAEPRPLVRAVFVVLASVALLLDGADGQVARHTGTATALGARFDMETDAVLILVLSIHVSRDLGWWVLGIGAARYLLLLVRVAGRRLPWLRGSVAPRLWRKAVAVYQGIVLTTAAAGVIPRSAEVIAVAAGLALLLVSFGTEIATLRRQADGPVQSRRATAGKVLGHVATGLGLLLVWLALVAPAPVQGWQASPLTLLRIPLEGVVLLVLLLTFRGALRHWIEIVAGVLLGVLLLVRVLDAAFLATLYRQFNPLTDWRYAGSVKDLVGDAAGPATAALAIAAITLLVLVLLVGMPLAVRHLGRLVTRHRSATALVVAASAPMWLAFAAFGVTPVPATPVASTSTAALAAREVTSVRSGLRDLDVFAAQIPVDRFAASPPADLLTALRGKDVVVVFVESYGRVAIEQSPAVVQALDAGQADLRAAGFESRSAWLTSPTFGGISWLAHSTFQSGLWVDSQQRYDQLFATGRFTLAAAFNAAGWRTVDVIPANRSDWPEGKAFYGYDDVHDSRTLGYKGTAFGYAPIPDQFTLSAFDRLELAPRDRRPVMAEIDLVTSHVPWAPVPQLADWGSIGDGSGVLAAAGSAPSGVGWGTPADLRKGYGPSVAYSLDSLFSFLRATHDDNLVVVMLGDHQPAAAVSGDNASHDVPVSIIACDPAVLQRIDGWQWHDGLRPAATAPTWPMDQFRDRFLTAYGQAGE